VPEGSSSSDFASDRGLQEDSTLEVVAAEGHALAAKEVICAVAGRSCAWFKSLSSDQVGAPTGGWRATTARGRAGRASRR
jgi:hypothetical protein